MSRKSWGGGLSRSDSDPARTELPECVDRLHRASGRLKLHRSNALNLAAYAMSSEVWRHEHWGSARYTDVSNEEEGRIMVVGNCFDETDAGDEDEASPGEPKPQGSGREARVIPIMPMAL